MTQHLPAFARVTDDNDQRVLPCSAGSLMPYSARVCLPLLSNLCALCSHALCHAAACVTALPWPCLTCRDAPATFPMTLRRALSHRQILQPVPAPLPFHIPLRTLPRHTAFVVIPRHNPITSIHRRIYLSRAFMRHSSRLPVVLTACRLACRRLRTAARICNVLAVYLFDGLPGVIYLPCRPLSALCRLSRV